MSKTFEVERTIVYDCTKTMYYTVDYDEYKEWLNGEFPNDDTLREYLDNLEPDDIEDDYDQTEDIVEAEDLFKELDNDESICN